MGSSLKLLLNNPLGGNYYNPRLQIKKKDGVIKGDGEKPTNIFKYILEGIKRYFCESIQRINQEGIDEYFSELDKVSDSLATKAREVFQDRRRKGCPLTLRAVRQLAMEEFCNIEFLNKKVLKYKSSFSETLPNNRIVKEINESLEILEIIQDHLELPDASGLLSREVEEKLNIIRSQILRTKTLLRNYQTPF